MQKYQNNIIGSTGAPCSGATITVYSYPSGSLATIYLDNSGTANTNPIIADSLGNFSFYAPDGRYSLSISGNGIVTQTISDILLEDPANASAVNISGGTINSTPIGATTPSTGAFTTLSSTGATALGQTSVTGALSATGTTQVNHTGSLSNALQIGDQTTPANNTGLYMRTSGLAQISYSGGGSLVVYNGGLAVGEIFRINTTGVAVLAGGATSATGTGIAFPATQLASTDPNTLDDYREGTWTPSFTALTVVNGTGGATYSGTYTKVGRLVKWKALISTTGTATTASTAGTTVISNLPFTSSTVDTAMAASTSASFGIGFVQNATVFTPTWSATNATIAISGTYEV